MGKCRFKPGWLTEYSWVQKTNDIRKAHCWVCMKTIDVGGMGESALKSHKKVKTLKENMKLRSKQGSCDVFFVKQEGTIVKTVKSKTDLKNNSPSVSNQEGTATCRECADRRFKFQDLRNFQL
ncbi:hypothetical protein DPMN_044186 [Dreissena polymorpha]|uniref:Uncharacterized protein n=1 Tax=Dreissena polymorpha TaxID=45954 RepID=A0A9D4D1Y2_DREPO|nr:hypothetical protein DPMN_044186 [Dreissena polymorpha]